jgi:hypothetical protein
MNRGCLTLLGSSLTSLFVFGVMLEALNDPKQLTAIPFTTWDFLTYALIALAILALIDLFRKLDPGKALAQKWTSKLQQGGVTIRTILRLVPDGNAVINTTATKDGNSRELSAAARWQLLDAHTLHIWGAQTTATSRILKLNSWRMITVSQDGTGSPVYWTRLPSLPAIPLKWLCVIGAAVVIPLMLALTVPRSQPSHAIADDPQDVLPATSHHAHRLKR